MSAVAIREVALLIQALGDVRTVVSWPLPRWDLLIRQARSADLLARLAALIKEAGLTGEIPEGPRRHLLSAQVLAQAQAEEAVREVGYVVKALAPLGVPVLLLKGAAYLMAGLPAAKGRLFSDLDLLVARERLPQVEAALMLNGWATTHHDPYDQRYYRQWMHELPPMEHVYRLTVLDVHHSILPDTARLKPEARKLLAQARPVAANSPIHVLSPADMVLHGATHLFHNEELSHGLRDLSDLDLLLRHFGQKESFWQDLAERASELDLTRPLHYGLRHSVRLFSTPVPAATLNQAAVWAPPLPLHWIMDALWRRALRPPHPSCADRFTSIALFLLYVRAHWLRMPPHLLFRHLTVKALRRHREEAEA